MPNNLFDKKLNENIKDWEAAHKELTKRYHALLDNIGDTYCEIDLTGTATFINENASRYLGYNKEEFIGKKYKDYMTPETAKKVFSVYNNVFKTGKSAKSIEYDLIAKDGTTKFIQDTIILRRDDTGNPIGFASFSRDITEKKLAEMALRQSEEKYRSILENIGDAYVEHDLTGTVTFLNVNATLLLGYNRKEFVGMNYKEFSSPETAKKLFDIFYTVYKTGKPNIRAEYELIAKDRSTKIIQAYVDLLHNPSGEPIGFKTVSRDITHQKMAEIKLKNSEEKYRNILDNMLEGYIETDLKGNVVFSNKAACESMGYSKEEFRGVNYKTFYATPEDAKDILKIYNTVYKTGKKAIVPEQKRITKDGLNAFFEVYVDLIRSPSGEPIGFKTLRRDITEKKKAEIILKKSEERYKNILENMLDAYTEVDLFGKNVFANKKAYEVMGYTKEEYLNMIYKDFTTPENADKIFAIYNGVYKTGKPATLVEYALTAKDHTTRFIEANVNLIRDDFGKPIGFTELSRDITEKKQAEKEKKKLETQLQYAQKMESIGTLAGGIAHDFNNLLMGILGLNSLMLADTDTSHPHHEYLKEIEAYVKNAVDLTRQLLGFARGGKYEVKPTNINELLKKHNRMFGRTRKEINITSTYDNNLWIAEVDQGQIEQVLMNIYLNAWHAMPEGGDLSIKTENVIVDENFVLPFKIEPGKYIQISIKDTGIGMDEKTQQRVFDPFFTTKEKERGTGLGLPSALGIVKNHGGFIIITSKPAQGSTFKIYLPASTKKLIEKIKSEEEALRGSGTILLIDDEQMILNVGEKILKRLGYDVILANNGNEGLDKYRKNREKIDMVILDMIMPGISGSDTYEALKKMNADIKVLLASGYSLDGKAKSILDKGCGGFIQKPFSMKQLSHKVSEILTH